MGISAIALTVHPPHPECVIALGMLPGGCSDRALCWHLRRQLCHTQEFNGEIRDKFGNQTGWRVCEKKDKYSWRRSDQFEYDFEKAPRGHLPSCLWAAKEDGWFSNRRDRLIALFACMDACSISNTLQK